MRCGDWFFSKKSCAEFLLCGWLLCPDPWRPFSDEMRAVVGVGLLVHNSGAHMHAREFYDV